MSDQEHDDKPSAFHVEGSTVVFDKPQSQEEIDQQRREDEQHEFARQQVKTNKRLTWFTGLLVLGTFAGTAISIWQASIAQTAANAARDSAGAAKSAADTAKDTLTYTEANNATLTSSSEKQFRTQLRKLDASIQQANRLASAMEETNRISGLQFEAQASSNRAILEINGLGLKRLDSEHLDFQFHAGNTGQTQALNVRYFISEPIRVRWDIGDHPNQIEQTLLRLRPPSKIAFSGQIPDILGNESSDSILVQAKPIDFGSISIWDTGNFFTGILEFDDMYGYHWKRDFCVTVGIVVPPARGNAIAMDCRIPQEGLHRTSQNNELMPKPQQRPHP